ncbi:AAEL011727-PA [Aedes aegypti]|uniref:Molybdenum cofactor sulfurase 2 n=1 Tax=Aedes aegypti TaxID=7159 RepID=MOCO2_AEDAE|nr:RecName: Full=Molybdenum cofactor sulfurase 2; Short=MCS 2; Short=MOS 2; Short=MoCo sulfurase 2; AltName: Full=Molybdenum cofactor sulfurtransferase 2; AltName: Full=Protein maroon-like 2; Short=Ma-l 2 [Aedes aegypti]EAT36182.1 AAEL011727-PA [Aedes aegypti]
MEFEQEYTAEEALNIEKEFTRLKGKHYMDHAGTTLYAESQIRAVHDMLAQNLFCNPHSSPLTGKLLQQVRHRLLRFFNTSPSDYSLVFTSGATASLKLVAESFRFRPPDEPESSPDEGAFVYLRDNHTSVLGMRSVVGTERIDPLEPEELLRHLKVSARCSGGTKPSLLVFPAQNNFNAAKYPLDLVEEIQQNGLSGYDDERFYVCLDAASYVSTNFLDLGRYRPDFVCMSFYKIFGYPTGLGALLIRNGSEDVLDKKYYGGGTIKIMLSGQNLHLKHDDLVTRFEDGTQPFLSIISLLEGMNTIQRLIPAANGYRPMERISKHVFSLAKYCYRKLGTLQHANGKKAILFYSDTRYETRDRQGGIVTFNVLKDDGSHLGFSEFAKFAGQHQIYVRTGCFCNAGSCQKHLGLTDEDILMFYEMGKVCGDDTDMIEGRPTGTVRVSFGYMNKKEDVNRLVDMINDCFVSKAVSNVAMVSPIRNVIKNEGIALKAIYLYPIRSCGGYRITAAWPLTERGLKYDREFTIVDSNGNPLMRNKHAEMSTIHPKIDPSLNFLILTHPFMEDLILKIRKLPTEFNDGESIDLGDAAAAWISKALRMPKLRLLRTSATDRKPPHKLLMINWDAMKTLSDDEGVESDATMSWLVDHFRGSLIVEGKAEEDLQGWKEVKIGKKRFKVQANCSRCPMIHVDQSGEAIPADSLKAIANVFTKKIPLGVHLTAVDEGFPEGVLECGSILEPVRQSDSPKAHIIKDSVSTRYNFLVK